MDHICPVCESEIMVSGLAEVGDRFVCENCFAELALHRFRGEHYLGCPFCKKKTFDPTNCGQCERRSAKVEQWRIEQFIKM